MLRLQQERLDRYADADEPIEKRLRGAAADVVVTTIENLDDASIFFRSMHHLGAEKNRQVRAERRRYHERFRALIEEGQREGVFSTATPPTWWSTTTSAPSTTCRPGTAPTARSARSRSPTTWPTCCCGPCVPDARRTARQPAEQGRRARAARTRHPPRHHRAPGPGRRTATHGGPARSPIGRGTNATPVPGAPAAPPA
ncbi:hypothetical protein SHKM778_65640 [Streptomyces sp. KM77-8]|uniref:HTH-type transcriptional repressor KstR2 C-terminal domain-containing protein n=1 Tax=Streptomyces haneummycinicus TaxID=3074435 RepID=A0AAT9HS91_9ACTN